MGEQSRLGFRNAHVVETEHLPLRHGCRLLAPATALSAATSTHNPNSHGVVPAPPPSRFVPFPCPSPLLGTSGRSLALCLLCLQLLDHVLGLVQCHRLFEKRKR